MSTHYVDLRVLPDPEFSAQLLLNELFARLHRVLVAARRDSVAVSFPGYGANAGSLTLGDRLRVVAPADELATLQAQAWLGGLRDQLNISELRAVPHNAQPRTLRRVQVKSSPARLMRRHARRHGLSEAEASARVPAGPGERLALPYLEVRSSSTGQEFRLYLRLGPPEPEPRPGSFNAYGLSASATVPWF
jgi:CRISPR-associated endonuclease Csy4